MRCYLVFAMLQVCSDIIIPIEHLWAPCSRWLVGVSLSACAEGESVPPAYQTVSKGREGKACL